MSSVNLITSIVESHHKSGQNTGTDGRTAPVFVIMVAFFNSFRKGTVFSLDLDLSGKVAKKNDSDTEKRSPRPHSLGPPHPPLAIAAYEICH